MKKIGILLLLSFLITGIKAEITFNDTLRVALPDLEGIFIKNNIELLAAQFNIEASKAEILQSKLWENPSIYLEQNIYNQYTKKVFDATKTGQNIVQVQQLIYLAGKRNKRINLAQINSQIAEYQFYDLIRTLRYELRSLFFDTHYKMRNIEMYDEEIANINQTVEIFEILIKKGTIAKKELIRVKALLLSLESERLEVVKQILENQKSLNVLLNLQPNKFVFPLGDFKQLDSLNTISLSLQALEDSALQNRLDLKIYESDIQYQQGNLAYQKSLAVPDIKIGGVYDRAGSYIQNYTGLSLSMDLPVLNRNQGNIALARAKKQQSTLQYNQYRLEVVSEVTQAYNRSLETTKIYDAIDKNMGKDFESLIDVIVPNYEKRNISLIEFIDFYQAYKTTMLQLNRMKNDKFQASEQLNYYIGKSILKY